MYQTFINEHIQESERATILSMISFAGSLVGMGFKPLIGALADINLYTTFLTFGVLLVLIAIIVKGTIRG